MITITAIYARQILDSRGNPTVEVDVRLSDGTLGRAAVPSGASTGTHESLELRDHDPKFCGGKSVLRAIAAIRDRITPALLGADVTDQSTIDRRMVELDGTENRRNLGANAILGISMAVAQAAAIALGKPLFRYIASLCERLDSPDCSGGDTFGKPSIPIPMVNVLNGGRHAANGISVQEFMIVPMGFDTFRDRLWATTDVFHALKEVLRERGELTGVGDEGGFAPRLSGSEAALDRLSLAVERAGYRPGEQMAFALDCAASEFCDPRTGRYVFDGQESDVTELIDRWENWCDRYPILSIEDGCAEDDMDGWKDLTRRFRGRAQTDGKGAVALVGDDLFVTSPVRLRRGIEEGIADAILIKLNQIGTVTETLETMSLARRHGYRTIVSHRSGETEDTFIADFAVGTGAGWIKTGSVSRGERTCKYNQLLRIGELFGSESGRPSGRCDPGDGS
ncbi:MAG: phosphopyruvate hydratase [Planctomycetia bacterium]|nr:phosphopyruvate hydratase [Planctomycetia bacterium]